MRYPLGGRRVTGVAVPLPALRTAESGGIGEYPDLVPFGALCASVGVELVQLLPVNDTGRQSSPYSAQSAFALHPLYLRLAALPEAKGFDDDIAAIKREFDDEGRFRFRELLGAKTAVLRAMFDKNKKAIQADRDLAAWTEATTWLKPYAAFCALKERHDFAPWTAWGEYADPTPADLDRILADPELADEARFASWLQWRCEGQFAKAAAELAGRGVALKGDIPILMNEDSADVWASRRYFDRSRRAGAPPDMFSRFGQNWDFPIYDWDAIGRDGFSFWKARLAAASKFYGAFRIDHVLGFFRIWCMGDREGPGYLGRFVPGGGIARAALAKAGFDDNRIRWLSEPHVPGGRLRAALSESPDSAADFERVVASTLDRIGNEDLFLFKRSIRGDRDLAELPIPDAARAYLVDAWRDRVLLDRGDAGFVPTWRHHEATAWNTLSGDERGALETLFASLARDDEARWEREGERLLREISSETDMLACAEDLGAVPVCVPRVLERLGILGLRIPRWARAWDAPGHPYTPLGAYPELSVCAASVHDTSTLREWWEREPDSADFWRSLATAGEPKPAWSPETAALVLERLSACSSRIFVAQLQDFLALSKDYASADPKTERINVPGTVNDFNWTWRMPACVETLSDDAAWKTRVARIAERNDR